MKKLCILAAVLVLGACQSVDIEKVGYGAYPENHEQIVKDYFSMAAKDPDSLKYHSISKPVPKYRKRLLPSEVQTDAAGYMVCAVVNGKNSYGAYTGYRTTAFLIRDDKIIVVYPDGRYMGDSVCN